MSLVPDPFEDVWKDKDGIAGEGKLSPEDEKAIGLFLEKLAKFSAHETENCPHCDKPIKALQKIGRCVYARPCNCRVWQGDIPKAWKVKL